MRRTITLIGVILLVIVAIWVASHREQNTTNGDSGGGGTSSQSSSAVSYSTMNSQPASTARELSCGDAQDNDADTLTDCDDPDCAGSTVCRCSVLACDTGLDPQISGTCRREEGCMCDANFGCVACRQEQQTCETSADCCYGLNLECRQIRKTSGETEKRCLPMQASVCTIRCTDDGTGQGIWSTPKACADQLVPPGTEDCAVLVGMCDLSANDERNQRKCWQG